MRLTDKEIVEAIRCFKKVRRESWPYGWYTDYFCEERWYRLDGDAFPMSACDVHAEDWVVAKKWECPTEVGGYEQEDIQSLNHMDQISQMVLAKLKSDNRQLFVLLLGTIVVFVMYLLKNDFGYELIILFICMLLVCYSYCKNRLLSKEIISKNETADGTINE